MDFFSSLPAPPIGGTAGAFSGAMLASHYSWFTAGVQVITGAMLLVDRFVPLAIVLLAVVISNILVFHITMMPSGLPMALVVTLLWFIVAWPLRSQFGALFMQKVS